MRLIFLIALMTLLMSCFSFAIEVDSLVEQQLETSSNVDVIVILKDTKDISDAAIDMSNLVKDKKLKLFNLQNKKFEAFGKRKIAIAANQDNVLLNHPNFKKKIQYNTINAFSGTVDKETLEQMQNDDSIERVIIDKTLQVTLTDSVPLINANDVWQRQINGNNITGKNVGICIVDTGIDYTHPDLGGCFGAGCKVISGYDFVNSDNDPMDGQGHGTHVAGIAAANGSVVGVAPEASLIAVKSMNDANPASGTDSGIAAGIDWCVTNAVDFNISVISLSLGEGGEYNSTTPCPVGDYLIEDAIAAAHEAGIVVTVASGNNGHVNGISYPACSPNATSVGATTKADVIASYSNGGALLDVLAPGSSIVSTIRGGGSGANTGTSMATPHVAGVVALIVQDRVELGLPVLNSDEIEQVIKDSAVVRLTSNGFTFPRVDAFRSVMPIINVTNPTPENASTISVNTADFNITLSNKNASEAILEFNDANYSMSGSGDNFYFTRSLMTESNYTYKFLVNDSLNNFVESGLYSLDVVGCIVPTNGINITMNTTFCHGTYPLSSGINIVNDNVYLDCNESVIAGSNSGTAINVSANNTIIMNCNLSGFEIGIYTDKDYLTFSNNYVENSNYGLYTDSTLTGIISNNSFVNNQYGIYNSQASFNVEYNYWGNSNYTLINSNISGTVDFDPWYVNLGYTETSDNDSDGYSSIEYNSLDCNDNNNSINQNVNETLDNVDEDCDSYIDEGLVTGLVNYTGYSDLNVTVGSSDDLSQQFSGNSSVVILGDNLSSVEFNYDFDTSYLNLSLISVEKQSSGDVGYILVSGVPLSAGNTKTVYFDDLNSTHTGVCVKDAVVLSLSDISDACNGVNEYSLDCSSSGYTLNGYTCTDLGTTLKVQGLNNSGVKEFSACTDVDGDTYGVGCYRGTDCNDNNSLINPSASEVCSDSIDNDCDGNIDEGCGGGGGGGGSGGGSGGGASYSGNYSATAGDSQTVYFVTIVANEDNVMKVTRDNLTVTKVSFTSKSEKGLVKLKARKVDLPKLYPSAGKVYEYFEVVAEGMADKDYQSAVIDFKVSKDLVKGNVVLKHFTEQWEELDTMLVSSDNNYNYYTAETPSFSYFAVVLSETNFVSQKSEPVESVVSEIPAVEEKDLAEVENEDEFKGTQVTGNPVVLNNSKADVPSKFQKYFLPVFLIIALIGLVVFYGLKNKSKLKRKSRRLFRD